MKRGIQCAGLLLLMAGAAVFHEAVGQAVWQAGSRCVTVLVPSLYFFTILAGLFVSSGMLETAALPLRRLPGVDGRLLMAVLFSQIGGYPVGAQLLHSMYRCGSLTAAQERRMLCVCMGCGPGFLLGTVCAGLPPQMSAWLMVSVSLPNLIIMPFLARGISLPRQDSRKQDGVRLLTDAVEHAAAAMLKICAMVMAFAAVTAVLGALLHGMPLPQRVTAMCRSVLEISCITEYMARGGSYPAAAALLSFGGICVHLQAAAICEGNVDWLRFWLCRGLAAVLACLLAAVGVHFLFADALPVQLSVPQAALEHGSVLPGCCLLLMSVMLLRTADRRKTA